MGLSCKPIGKLKGMYAKSEALQLQEKKANKKAKDENKK